MAGRRNDLVTVMTEQLELRHSSAASPFDTLLVGIDVGGTFTDLVATDGSGQPWSCKTPSTPDDPSRGVMDALRLLAAERSESLAELLPRITLLVHGTTVATNTLVERRGARLGLITTRGFRDLLELRDGSRTDRYALRTPAPEAVIPRPLRLEVGERVSFDGTARLQLERAAVEEAIAALREAEVEGVVVCFLHAHTRPDHERAVRDMIEASGWKPFVSLGHEVLGREGEYDRLSTATVNAYVGPRLQQYLDRLMRHLADEGVQVPVQVMQSHGGVLPISQAAHRAVGAVTSGPAGGAVAGGLYARTLGLPRLITYDTGGTTTDVCLVENGEPVERGRSDLAGMPIVAPTIEINPLGIGGGSLAELDAAGILNVGPRSAGAVPGPACFGKGGVRATLTDANLVLGLVSATTFLGGRMPLDVERARAAIAADIAEPLGTSVEAAAWAVHVLATSRITEGIRLATVRRGFDPRDFALMSFGGAGGLHANAVALDLQIPSAIVPAMASVLSALGFLAADMRQDRQCTVNRPIRELSPTELARLTAELEHDGLSALAAEGQAGGSQYARWTAECRYARQIHTVAVPFGPQEGPAEIEARFVESYGELYGHTHPDEPGIIEACRVSVFGSLPKLVLPDRPEDGDRDPSPALIGTRPAYLGRPVEAPVYWFDDLRPGMIVPGPALVDSASTSVLILESSHATLDRTGSLTIAARRKDDPTL